MHKRTLFAWGVAGITALGGCNTPDPSPASWSSQVEAALVAAEYAPTRHGSGWVATNRAQGLRVSF